MGWFVSIKQCNANSFFFEYSAMYDESTSKLSRSIHVTDECKHEINHISLWLLSVVNQINGRSWYGNVCKTAEWLQPHCRNGEAEVEQTPAPLFVFFEMFPRQSYYIWLHENNSRNLHSIWIYLYKLRMDKSTRNRLHSWIKFDCCKWTENDRINKILI